MGWPWSLPESAITGTETVGTDELRLRYGLNPHHAPARAYLRDGGPLPFRTLNGAPGYINLLDALNAWQLVRELRSVTGLPAATSFKHVSPAGAAVGLPLSEPLKAAYFVGDAPLSPLAAAYARARGADRVSSFGDWIGLSDTVDRETAELIRREVSDGIVAPGYAPEALEILSAKKNGAYVVLWIDASYEPPALETRDVFGITLEQRRAPLEDPLGPDARVVVGEPHLPDDVQRDLRIALTALKYTQSNSMALAVDGQTIGIGAGQQSRIHCTRLAASKADMWFLRQHPRVLGLPFKRGLGRPDRNNAVDAYLRSDLSPAEQRQLTDSFDGAVQPLTLEEKRAWLDTLPGVSMGSDAFIPFRDNVDRAAQSGVRYVAQPGGSARDQDVIAACQEYGISMLFTGRRLFHH